MVDVDKAVIAKLDKGKNHFEILVDCEKALEFKDGKGFVDDCLASFDIFKDVKKGEKASENILKNVFGTDDFRKVSEIIIKEGEVQITKEHKSKKLDGLRKQIIGFIHRNAIDSKTKLPHPSARIERAMDEARVKIDLGKSAEHQVEDIVEKLSVILPIKFEKLKMSLKVPAKFANAGFNVFKKYGKMLRQDWQGDGSLLVMIEMPAGLQDEFFNEINKVCSGEVESKIIKE